MEAGKGIEKIRVGVGLLGWPGSDLLSKHLSKRLK